MNLVPGDIVKSCVDNGFPVPVNNQVFGDVDMSQSRPVASLQGERALFLGKSQRRSLSVNGDNLYYFLLRGRVIMHCGFDHTIDRTWKKI